MSPEVISGLTGLAIGVPMAVLIGLLFVWIGNRLDV